MYLQIMPLQYQTECLMKNAAAKIFSSREGSKGNCCSFYYELEEDPS